MDGCLIAVKSLVSWSYGPHSDQGWGAAGPNREGNIQACKHMASREACTKVLEEEFQVAGLRQDQMQADQRSSALFVWLVSSKPCQIWVWFANYRNIVEAGVWQPAVEVF